MEIEKIGDSSNQDNGNGRVRIARKHSSFELDERDAELDLSPLYPPFNKRPLSLQEICFEKPYKQCNMCHINKIKIEPMKHLNSIVICLLVLWMLVIALRTNKKLCDDCPIDFIIEEKSTSDSQDLISSNNLPYKYFNLTHDFRNISRYVQSKNGVISTRSSICTEMGSDILKKGGNAVDAMVTTSLCCGIVAPYASGIGGGVFIMIHMNDGESGMIDAREYAGQHSYKDMFKNRGKWGSLVGGHAIAVPLELLGLEKAFKLYGSGNVKWSELLEPVIDLADKGFGASPELVLQYYNPYIFGLLTTFEPMRNTFLIQDNFHRAPYVLENCCSRSVLADTLQKAQNGVEEMYKSDWANHLVDDILSSSFGGNLTYNDIHKANVQERDVLTSHVFGLKVLYPRPPSSAAVIVTALKLLESYNIKKEEALEPQNIHLIMESIKHAFAIRTYFGDTGKNFEFNAELKDILEEIKSDKYIEELKKITLKDGVLPQEKYGGKYNMTSTVVLDSGSSHVSIIDKDRNTVSMTACLKEPFGSFVLSTQTGVILNAEMHSFSNPDETGLASTEANYIVNGKKPISSLSPIIFLKDGNVKLSIGGTGGKEVISSMVQVIYNLFVAEMDPFEAVKRPRVFTTLIPNEIRYEDFSIGPEKFKVDTDITDYLDKIGNTMVKTSIKTSIELVMMGGDEDEVIGIGDPRIDAAASTT